MPDKGSKEPFSLEGTVGSIFTLSRVDELTAITVSYLMHDEKSRVRDANEKFVKKKLFLVYLSALNNLIGSIQVIAKIRYSIYLTILAVS